MEEVAIKTSEKGWLERLAKSYKEKQHVVLVDDAEIGINPAEDSLLTMGKRAGLTRHEWAGVAISLGVAATGVFLVVMAVLDPEPFSKITVALVSGAILTLSGGLSAVKLLTGQKPPRIQVTKTGFDISWND